VPMFWVYLAIPAGCFLMMLGFWEVALRSLRDGPPPGASEAPKNLTVPG
jgi:TRAP-type C4-dicarboxylate transport system permease small subunit